MTDITQWLVAGCGFVLSLPIPAIAAAPNLARLAEVSVSNERPEYPRGNAVDGNRSTEWAAMPANKYVQANSICPWIRLDWKQPVSVGRLVLCDRADPKENAQGGKLLFSDGSTLDVDDIPPDGKPREIRFAPRTVTWMRLDLFSSRGAASGLAEIEVYADSGPLAKPVPPTHPAPGTVVNIGLNDARITTLGKLREGEWSAAMWCPFEGTSVKLTGNTGPGNGIADIYVDGIFRKTADWYSEKDVRGVTVFTAQDLADGKHLLGILARGTRRPGSIGTAIDWTNVEFIAGTHPDRFVPSKRTRFDPNVPLWLDDQGEPLQCHMGGIMPYQNKYYMVGWDWRGSKLPDFPYGWLKNAGFSVYSSQDLMNWTYHGNFCKPVSELGHPLYDYTHAVSRVRLLRATGSGKFVALFELVDETFNYSYEVNHIAVALADKPEGPYAWHGFLQFEGRRVTGADTAVFTDDDGTQYLVTSGVGGGNVADTLYQLAPDGLSAVKARCLATGGEGAAMFKHDGVYFLLHSKLSGLADNDNFYHTATDIWGPWQARGNIAQGEHHDATFMTQTMDVVPVAGKKNAFVWIGDSLRGGGFTPTMRTVWLPVTLQGKDGMEIRWRDSWDVSVFDQ